MTANCHFSPIDYGGWLGLEIISLVEAGRGSDWQMHPLPQIPMLAVMVKGLASAEGGRTVFEDYSGMC
jgi:hypothetical protein